MRFSKIFVPMPVQFKRTLYCLTAVLCFSLTSAITGIGASIELPNKSAEEADRLVKKTLDKLQVAYRDEDVTDGFAHRYTSRWYSPFDVSVYIGSYPNRAIVHVASTTRQSYAFADALLIEDGQGPFEKKYSEKSLFLSTASTLISPGLGHYYINSGTPFRTRSSTLTSLGYLGVDLVLFWLGSKTFFTHGIDPLDRGLIPTLILMGGYRLYALVPFSLQIIAHNRFAGLGYTFRF